MVERVDFYILPGDAEEARWDFACRLTEKAYKLGNVVCLLVETVEEATRLDEHLWVFRPESFVPHQLFCADTAGQAPAVPAAIPVVIAAAQPPAQPFDLLINLAPKRLGDLSQLSRLAEIVTQDPQVLLTTRQQFSYYKSLQVPVLTHKL